MSDTRPPLLPLNILVLDDVLDEMDRIPGQNRSETTRSVLAAIIESAIEGDMKPFDEAVSLANATDPANRVRITDAFGVGWRKAIVHIPNRMHDELKDLLHETDILPSGLVRGALFGITGAAKKFCS